ncbi:MAG TPA: hypothetical protein ENL06_01170 [Candidatus Portnoybacteria bacterium]|nr:hypothetical protein [Candidatus Portnoybacteria bacterium]
MDIQELRKLDPQNFIGKRLSQTTILEWFKICNAYLFHSGDPKEPHMELTSGKCSNGYFNCPEVLKHPNINEILAHQLTQKLRENSIESVDWVIGSPYSGITFSYEVAKALGAIHSFTEKDPSDPKGKRMIWRRMTIPEDSVVLQVEELITTSGTFKEVRRAVEEGNKYSVNFLSVVGTLVHRPPRLPAEYDGREVVALVEKEVWAVDQKDCPLCRAGSPRYRPKSHWGKLTGEK